jgi:hypothetical protein
MISAMAYAQFSVQVGYQMNSMMTEMDGGRAAAAEERLTNEIGNERIQKYRHQRLDQGWRGR